MTDKNARWAVGVFGDNAASGSWRTAAMTRAVAGFGDVRVIVPAGGRVEISGFALFGSKGSEIIGDPNADGPLARVKGWALFGDVRVA